LVLLRLAAVGATAATPLGTGVIGVSSTRARDASA